MTDSAKPIVASPFSFTPYKEKEGEEYMNEAQLKHFETILNNWKAELMHEVDRTVHHKKIDDSLKEIESGDYGFCESCGIEIGIRRLEARPTATLCIDCKTLDEIREKQMG
ncbi:MAG: TraR/DksA C4-type zinc finger protein [Methylococcaceae bacterium]|nr:TraR/DksA C4-type zinc finger protein [Methylococcaceae bacterium]